MMRQDASTKCHCKARLGVKSRHCHERASREQEPERREKQVRIVDTRRCDRTGANLKLEAPSLARVDPTEWGLASLNLKDTVPGSLHLASWDLVGRQLGRRPLTRLSRLGRRSARQTKTNAGRSPSNKYTWPHLGCWMGSKMFPLPDKAR